MNENAKIKRRDVLGAGAAAAGLAMAGCKQEALENANYRYTATPL